MKTFRRILPVILSASGLAAACIGSSVGCGSSDDSSTSPPIDSGTDGTVGDAAQETGDAAKMADGGDATVGDGGVDSGTTGLADADAAVAEKDADAATESKDATADADAATKDASADANADTGVTFFDAGEAGLSVATYATEVARAYCQSIQNCCVPDAGAVFDFNKCVATQAITNFNQDVALSDAGNVVLDMAKAQACLNDLASVSCTDVTAAAVGTQYTDCYGALVGTTATGGACASAIECNLTSFCDLPLDGGTTGTCQPLRTTGQSCSDFGSQDLTQSEQACSHRGSGLGGLRCANANLDGTPIDPSSWTCQPAVDATSDCNVSQDCTTLLCDPGPDFNNYTCVTDQTFIYQFACESYYDFGDAGDGG